MTAGPAWLQVVALTALVSATTCGLSGCGENNRDLDLLQAEQIATWEPPGAASVDVTTTQADGAGFLGKPVYATYRRTFTLDTPATDAFRAAVQAAHEDGWSVSTDDDDWVETGTKVLPDGNSALIAIDAFQDPALRPDHLSDESLLVSLTHQGQR
ncbi:hypothetical protein NUM3379_01420 [Kineococcus sp. NUM-3379]